MTPMHQKQTAEDTAAHQISYWDQERPIMGFTVDLAIGHARVQAVDG